MQARKTRIIATALAVLAGFALVFIAFGPLAPGRMEARLADAAREALDARGHDWARIEMNGQVLTLSGVAPSESARGDAMAAARSAVWAGGVVAGGVTRVRDETMAARLSRGFGFRADLNNGRVVVRGDVSDASARERLTDFAEAQFPSGAEIDLTLAPGGAPGPEWADAAESLLGQLARLDRGSAVMIGERAALIGDAANAQLSLSVSAALSSLTEPYQASHIINPNGAPIDSRIADALACEAVIEAARGPGELRFDIGAPTPSPRSLRLLDEIGAAFAHCPRDLMLIASVRIEEGGEDLASERAGSVADWLSAAGAPLQRVSPVLADQQTRGVEFTVTANPAASNEEE